jgi:hypothetical protein
MRPSTTVKPTTAIGLGPGSVRDRACLPEAQSFNRVWLDEPDTRAEPASPAYEAASTRGLMRRKDGRRASQGPIAADASELSVSAGRPERTKKRLRGRVPASLSILVGVETGAVLFVCPTAFGETA